MTLEHLAGMADPPVQLAPAGVRILAGDAGLAEQFRTSGMLALPGFLDESFVQLLDRADKTSTFVREVVTDLGEREIESPLRGTAAILLALRNRELLDWVAKITGSSCPLEVGGNIVRTWPGGRDRLDWHDDVGDVRRIAGLTIRLGMSPFEGGEFEMRAKCKPEAITGHHHARVGDALLFRVSPQLEHRVTPIASGGPRQMFAGWFMAAA